MLTQSHIILKRLESKDREKTSFASRTMLPQVAEFLICTVFSIGLPSIFIVR